MFNVFPFVITTFPNQNPFVFDILNHSLLSVGCIRHLGSHFILSFFLFPSNPLFLRHLVWGIRAIPLTIKLSMARRAGRLVTYSTCVLFMRGFRWRIHFLPGSFSLPSSPLCCSGDCNSRFWRPSGARLSHCVFRLSKGVRRDSSGLDLGTFERVSGGRRASFVQRDGLGRDRPCMSILISFLRASFLNHVIRVDSMFRRVRFVSSKNAWLLQRGALTLLYSDSISFHLEMYLTLPLRAHSFLGCVMTSQSHTQMASTTRDNDGDEDREPADKRGD